MVNNMIYILGLVLILVLGLLILPWIVVSLSTLYDKLSIRSSRPGQNFKVLGYNTYGVAMKREMILTKIEGNLLYFDYIPGSTGPRFAVNSPHHINNYKKSFWKV